MSISIYTNSSSAAKTLINDGLIGLKILDNLTDEDMLGALADINGLTFEASDKENGYIINADEINAVDIINEDTKIDFYHANHKQEIEVLANGSLSSSVEKAVKELDSKPAAPSDTTGPAI
jgi:hypothetical protein